MNFPTTENIHDPKQIAKLRFINITKSISLLPKNHITGGVIVRKFSLLIVVLGLIVVLCIPNSQATITLTNLNSTATIEPASQSGMNSWIVDGTSMLYQQWFWYRIGATGPEASIDTLSAPVIAQSAPNRVATTYLKPGVLEAVIEYTLLGGTTGSGGSDIAESIRIINRGSSPISLRFYQYTDFDLGEPGGDTVEKVNANAFRQWDANYAATETVGTPAPNRWEANYFSVTRDKLNDGLPSVLDNNAGPLTGNVTWAWQWNNSNLDLAAGGSLLISKDKHIGPASAPVPEPGTLILLGSGLLGLVGMGIVRKRKKA